MEQLKIQRSKVKIVREVVLGEEIDATLYEYIGFRVSELRKLANKSQKELGTELGLTRMSIINLERGRHGIMIKHLAKICEILNCKSSDILPF